MDKVGNEVRDVVAKHLSILRKSKKLTQRQVAEQVNEKYNAELKQATISSYEQGVTLPPLDVAVKLCQFYDTSIDWLCGITKDSEIKKSYEKLHDVTRTLFILCTLLPFVSIENIPSEFIDFGDEKMINDFNPIKLVFKGQIMQGFLSELKKMLDLYEANVIDEEVLNLWYEKAEDKYNMSVKEWNEPVIPF